MGEGIAGRSHPVEEEDMPAVVHMPAAVHNLLVGDTVGHNLMAGEEEGVDIGRTVDIVAAVDVERDNPAEVGEGHNLHNRPDWGWGIPTQTL